MQGDATRRREALFRPLTKHAHTVAELAALTGATSEGDGTVVVHGITLDSRGVKSGDLYAALPGANAHGAAYVPQAVAAGAVAVFTDAAGAQAALAAGVPVITVSDARAQLGEVSAAVYDTTTTRPELFAVTGTNGKTTTTLFLSALLEALGKRTGSIGTIGISVGDDLVASTMTTPEAPQLHGLFAHMADVGTTHATMEVSSHSLVFHRVAGLHFRVAGFTNLTQDHLDLHNTMQEYYEAKRLLFTTGIADSAVVVVDDEWGAKLAVESTAPVVTLATLGSTDADWWVGEVSTAGTGHEFTLYGPGEQTLTAVVGLAGRFNVANAALAIVMLVNAGLSLADIAAAIESPARPLSRDVPGRMEVVHDKPRVYVDFAHNPGGLMRVLEHAQADGERVIVVYGAAGERDALKRAEMGAIAATHATVSIITDDDPHHEDAAKIRADLMEGALAVVPEGHEVLEIFPRADAITWAAELAGPNDVVVVAGRGHETEQDIDGQMIQIDDREEVRRAFAR